MPPDQVLRFPTEMDIVRELQVGLPLEDFVVRLVCRLGAEGRVPDETLEHDGTE